MRDEYRKNWKFSILVDNVLEFDRGISYFEKYMTELQTGVFTAWKLYRIICGLISPEKKNEKPNEKLLESVTTLAESVGSIHNLDLRLHILDTVDLCIQSLQKDLSGDIYQGMEIISECVKENAKQYNQRLELIYKLFLYLYREDEQWKDLLGGLDLPTEKFSELLDEIETLHLKNHVEPDCLNQYNGLYFADGKRDRHKIYSAIRNSLEKGQGWLKLPEENKEDS